MFFIQHQSLSISCAGLNTGAIKFLTAKSLSTSTSIVAAIKKLSGDSGKKLLRLG
jgi:hypothetical protein